MKLSTILFGFIISLSYTVTAFSSSGLALNTITEYDVIGCQTHSNNPRCKQIMKVACRSICMGHFEEQGDFGETCKKLCEMATIKTISNKNNFAPK